MGTKLFIGRWAPFHAGHKYLIDSYVNNGGKDIEKISGTTIRDLGDDSFNRGHGLSVWLTGLSGAGKTTLADLARAELIRRGYDVMVLDGDPFRKQVTLRNRVADIPPDDHLIDVRYGDDRHVRFHCIDPLDKLLGYSTIDRFKNIECAINMNRPLVNCGMIVLNAFIMPLREMRAMARDIIGDRCSIVYIDTPLKACMDRDPKGLYARAAAGKLKDFTGLDAPYDEPEKPDLTVHAGVSDIDFCVDMIADHVEEKAG